MSPSLVGLPLQFDFILSSNISATCSAFGHDEKITYTPLAEHKAIFLCLHVHVFK